MSQNQPRATFPVVVHVLLLREAQQSLEFGLLRRANTGFMDGYYVPPGGHLEHGESLRAAAARECAEELGVVVRALTPCVVLPYRSGRHQGQNFVFECAAWHGDPSPVPAVADDWAWVGLDDALPAPSAPWLERLLELRRRGEWFAELEF